MPPNLGGGQTGGQVHRLRRGEGYRSDKVLLGDLADRKYSKWYPLMEWGWDRAACMQAIENAGLPQPGKSPASSAPA